METRREGEGVRERGESERKRKREKRLTSHSPSAVTTWRMRMEQ